MAAPEKKYKKKNHGYFERVGDEFEIATDQDENTWAVSFSDISTILLVFFILLLSFSVINPNKYEVVQKTIKGANIDTTNIKELEQQLEKVIQDSDIKNFVKVTPDDLGLNIEIQNRAMFASGSGKLNQNNRNLLRRLVREFTKLPKQYKFLIEGHTDNVPINDREYPSNWHLSAARALSVLNIFSEAGINDNRLRVEGLADTVPLKEYPLRDKNNNRILENLEKNRRVVIKVR